MGLPVIALVIAAIIVTIGVIGRFGQPYWIRGAAAVGVALLMFYLGSGRGTLENPGADGLITRAVRKATDDGTLTIVWVVLLLVGGYGAIIWLVQSGIRRSRRERPAA